MAKGAETEELILRTALRLADEQVIDEMSLRAIGRAAGLHHTAIYRYFPDRTAVLQAVAAMLVQHAFDREGQLPTDARARLFALFRLMRGVVHAHPQIAAVVLLPVASLSDSTSVKQFQTSVIAALREMGLEGHALAAHHRLLDSYVFGMSVFDFAGAPEHLTSRGERLMLIEDPDLELLAGDPEAVDALNEEAFALGLNMILDACERVGRR